MPLALPSMPLAPRSADLRRITERQLQCLTWVQAGKSASDIAGILGISPRTVEGHLLRICLHLGVRTRLQAVLLALELGLLPTPVEAPPLRQ